MIFADERRERQCNKRCLLPFKSKVSNVAVGQAPPRVYVSHMANHLAQLLANEDTADRQQRIDDVVNTINSLIIPRAYVTIEHDNGCMQMHLVVIAPKGTREESEAWAVVPKSVPTTLSYAAHVTWSFDPLNKTWLVTMRRSGAPTPTVHPTFKVR